MTSYDIRTDDVRADGFLLTPLAWARRDLMACAAAAPGIAPWLVSMDRSRMHLAAFALANLRQPPGPEHVEVFLTGNRRDVLAAVLGDTPRGLRGAFDRMPYRVMPRDTYIRLAALYRDPRSAKVLSHARRIDRQVIDLLSSVPAVLRRPVLLRLRELCHGLDGLVEGIRFLVDRGAAPDFDALASRLGTCRHPREFAAVVKRAAEALPLPAMLPPATVGEAVRIDEPERIRDLARRWHNCLAGHIGAIDRGEAALYLWREGDFRVACLVRRRGRFGWFLDEVRGPANAEPGSGELRRVSDAYRAANVPPSATIIAIENICDVADDCAPHFAEEVEIAIEEYCDAVVRDVLGNVA